MGAHRWIFRLAAAWRNPPCEFRCDHRAAYYASQRANHILPDTGPPVKQPPTVFIVDNRPAILSSLEEAVNVHGFLVECHSSAAQFFAQQDSSRVGCVLIDPLTEQGGVVLRWLHEADSLLSVVLISGLIRSISQGEHSPSAAVELRPHEASALVTMVTDGLAGSISRQVIRETQLRLKG
jgi:hypothetical protein